MLNLSSIKGMLFDLDGVLYVDTTTVAGAVEAVNKIRASGIRCRFVTNTSTLSLAALQKKIHAFGFHIPEQEIISAPQAAIRFLKKQGDPVCRLLLAEDVKKDFQSFRLSDDVADYIVVGDIGDAWTYPMLNQVFNSLVAGAKLIAIHKNKFWQTAQGLQMDIGGFIQALEYASGTQALIIGKPSPDFFQVALDDLQLDAGEVAMIGDDIDSDVGGAQQAGLAGILVRTGKYRQAYANASPIRPELVLDSINDLPAALELA